MITVENIKKKMSYFYILKKFKDYNLEPTSFKDFFKNANDLLIILPDTEVEFKNSLDIVYALAEIKMNIKLFIRDYRVSLVARKNTVSYLDYNIRDFTKFYLPTKLFLDNILEKKYDLLIDCNLNEDVFSSTVVASVNSKFKIGFKKGKTDRFFNVLIINNENNPAFSYRNLLNSLKMF